MSRPTILFSIFLATAGLVLPATLQAGDGSPSPRELFRKNCSVCHGVNGDAKSMASKGMVPPPTDFTAAPSLVTLTRERMIQSVTEGRQGTAMISWKDILTKEQIEGVVDYIRDALMLSSRDADASPGRRLFAANCSVCHGDKGDTAVWARSGLTPPPRDFTSDKAKQELARDRILFSITYGRPNTAMPAWGGRLKEEEIQQLADYILHAFIRPQEKSEPVDLSNDPHAAHNHGKSADLTAPYPNNMVGDIAWGKTFFNNNCATCHGEKGDGQGPRAFFIFPKPRDFTHPAFQHELNRPKLYQRISEGTRGSEMPAWNKVLTPQELANVSEYVFQSFVIPGRKGEEEHQHGDDHHAAPAATQHQDHQQQAPAAQPSGHDHQHPAPAAPAPAAQGHQHHDHAPAAPAPAAPAAPAAQDHQHHDHAPAAPAPAAPAAPAAQDHQHHDHAPAAPAPAPAPAAPAAQDHQHHDHAPAAPAPAPAPAAHDHQHGGAGH
ncbi:MAG: c-type cytochrome [Magnetococcales bacterium]|nr:c-type cytochrome [Magnetococcales bacterium]NGZ26725.1 c-type cytochrome [Magnetococcales bacterium]